MAVEGTAARFPAHLESLPAMTVFVEEQAVSLGMPLSRLLTLSLLLEEAAVNVCSYAYPDGEGTLELELRPCRTEGQPCGVTLVLRDWGRPFDPLAAPTPNVDQPVEERPLGGLGLLMIEQMSSACSYHRVGTANELSIRLDFEPEDATERRSPSSIR